MRSIEKKSPPPDKPSEAAPAASLDGSDTAPPVLNNSTAAATSGGEAEVAPNTAKTSIDAGNEGKDLTQNISMDEFESTILDSIKKNKEESEVDLYETDRIPNKVATVVGRHTGEPGGETEQFANKLKEVWTSKESNKITVKVCFEVLAGKEMRKYMESLSDMVVGLIDSSCYMKKELFGCPGLTEKVQLYIGKLQVD